MIQIDEAKKTSSRIYLGMWALNLVEFTSVYIGSCAFWSSRCLCNFPWNCLYCGEQRVALTGHRGQGRDPHEIGLELQRDGSLIRGSHYVSVVHTRVRGNIRGFSCWYLRQAVASQASRYVIYPRSRKSLHYFLQRLWTLVLDTDTWAPHLVWLVLVVDKWDQTDCYNWSTLQVTQKLPIGVAVTVLSCHFP